MKRADILRQLERWSLSYEEQAERIVIRDGERWMTIREEDGRWHYVTKRGSGTFKDDAALERLLEKAFPE